MTTTDIQARLRAVEADHAVRIVFAAESGSRAWGFASPDSDFDVRFLFVRTPVQYLSVKPPRDTIELPVDADGFDGSGWDLIKALRLFRKGNGPLLEWLHSPIVYRDDAGVGARLRALAAENLPALPLAHHYLALSRKMIEGDGEMSRKRLLYALRPLLVCRWMEAHRTPAPTAVSEILTAIDLPGPIRVAFAALIAAKQAGGERDVAPPDPALVAFLNEELGRMTLVAPTLSDPPGDDGALDALIGDTLWL